MSKTKLISFQEYEILYYYSVGKKKALHKKVIFGPKKCFYEAMDVTFQMKYVSAF